MCIRNSTSGLGKDGQPPLVLIYTAAGDPAVQCLASSVDGRHFTKFSGNPVLKQITGGNRDPKVIWHEATKKWVMVLYVTLPGGGHTVHFFNSPNLREWTLTGIVEGIANSNYPFACPDFFELPVGVRADAVRLLLHHYEDAEVFLNGVPVATVSGYTSDYEPAGAAAKLAGALKPGARWGNALELPLAAIE